MKEEIRLICKKCGAYACHECFKGKCRACGCKEKIEQRKTKKGWEEK